jgi:hypothetical protein
MDSGISGVRCAVIGVLLCAMAMRTYGATITVMNTNDSGSGSLRQGLAIADDGDTITFAVTGTITLTTGGLLIAKNVTISYPGTDQFSIDGNQALFVFGLFPGKTAAISGLTVTNGQFGIWNERGTLTVTNCIVTGNSADGLYNHEGTLTVNNCVVSLNSYGEFSNDHAALTITNCIVNDNAFYGLDNHTFDLPRPNDHVSDQPFVEIDNSIISGNSAQGGGGISNEYGLVSIVNSTISGNSAADGGGAVFNYAGALQIANSTISGNSAGSGGGVDNVPDQFGAATIETGNTIFDADASGENIFNNGGTVTSHGYNLSSDDGGGYLNGPGDQINTDPLLGPLQDNGGPTLTHMPLPASPAIDAGDPNFTPPPFHDQRGPCYYRVFGRSRRIDIGSVETQPERPCPAPRPRPTPP